MCPLFVNHRRGLGPCPSAPEHPGHYADLSTAPSGVDRIMSWPSTSTAQELCWAAGQPKEVIAELEFRFTGVAAEAVANRFVITSRSFPAKKWE